MKNILLNITAQAAFAVLILWLAKFFPVLGVYAELPKADQAFLAFFVTLAGFIFIIWLKKRALANYQKHEKLVKAIFYPFAAVFLLIDVGFNVTFGPWFLLQFANSYGEGWTFTSHCKAIKDYTEEQIELNEKLTTLEKVRYLLCEKAYGRILNLVEKRHYR